MLLAMNESRQPIDIHQAFQTGRFKALPPDNGQRQIGVQMAKRSNQASAKRIS